MNIIYSICSCFSKNKKRINIEPIELFTSSKHTNTRTQQSINPEKYYDIKSTIQHFQVLSDEDIGCMETLSSQNLIQFIKLYNLHVKNIRPIIDG